MRGARRPSPRRSGSARCRAPAATSPACAAIVGAACAMTPRRQLAVREHRALAGAVFPRHRAARRLRARTRRPAHRRRRRRRSRCSPTSRTSRDRTSSSARSSPPRRRRRPSRRRSTETLPGPTPSAGRAAFVRGAHVGLRPGGNDEIGLAHQREGLLARHRRRQHLHEVARRADAVELGVHVLEQQRERRGALRRRRDDDRIAALQCVDDVVRGRRRRIRRRRDRGDDADRPRDLDQAAPGSSAMTPTDFAPRRSRSSPSVLRRFLAILSATLPSPVSRTASSASASIARRARRSPSRPPTTASSTRSCVQSRTPAAPRVRAR